MTENEWRPNLQTIVVVFLVTVLCFSVSFGAVHVLNQQPTDYDYWYEVKTQQVMADRYLETENVTEYENLPPEKKRVLHDAFKEDDHFLGESHTSIEYDEPVNVTTGLYVVSVEGVHLLVSVSGPTVEETSKQPFVDFVLVMIIVISALLGLYFGVGAFVGVSEYVWR